MPVPAGISRPMMTFSFRPRRWSTFPEIDASVRTRVVSWKLAAEMKESVDSEALVMPEQQRPAARRRAARREHALVLLDEAEAVHLLVDDELGVARRPRP